MNDRQIMIKLNNIEFRWKPQNPLILNIEQFCIQQGERVFIKGSSGSGKSTLLSLLGGVLQPQLGVINVLGKDITQLRNSERDTFRADHIGFIFQMFNLIPYLSMLDNVALPLHFSKRRRERVLSKTSVQAEAKRLLAHLDLQGDLLTQPVTELSVGQQQRVAAARALIGSPEIVIADEPTSSLDADRREAFIKLLIDECNAAGNTLVFVSHDGSLESYFDRHVALAEINVAQKAVAA